MSMCLYIAKYTRSPSPSQTGSPTRHQAPILKPFVSHPPHSLNARPESLSSPPVHTTSLHAECRPALTTHVGLASGVAGDATTLAQDARIARSAGLSVRDMKFGCVGAVGLPRVVGSRVPISLWLNACRRGLGGDRGIGRGSGRSWRRSCRTTYRATCRRTLVSSSSTWKIHGRFDDAASRLPCRRASTGRRCLENKGNNTG